MNDIFNLFLKYNPDFINKLELFPEALKRTLLSKLNNAPTDTAFLSFVSEINFGLLFSELGFSLQYDKELFDNKTPDWEISIENTKAICEVYRLGQTDQDQKKSDFENKLKRGFEEIKYGYQIKYSFQEDCINADDFEMEKISSALKIWLSNNREVGEILSIENKIKFQIQNLNQKNKITYISTSKSIDYNINRLEQKKYFKSNNRVTEKLTKYSNNIEQLRIPYFVCIESDLKNGFYFDEFINYFQDSLCVYSEDDFIDNYENEIEYSELGCLYDYNTISGIILKIGNEYRKILNPLKNQLIYNNDNFLIFKRLNLIKNAST